VDEPVSLAVGTAPDTHIPVRRLTVTKGYVQTVGATVLEGREPTTVEANVNPEARPIVQSVMVNETLARMLRQHGPVLDQTLSSSPSLIFRVVGVLADMKHGRIDQPSEPTIYPFLPVGRTDAVLLVRATPGAVTASTIRVMLPQGMSAASVIDLAQRVNRETAVPRARARLLGIGALFGLVVLVVGLVSAIGESIREERHNIAIRLSLGGRRGHVVFESLRPIGLAAIAGLVGGLICGVVIMKWASSFVFSVRPIEAHVVVLCAISVLSAGACAAGVASRHVTDFNFARYLRNQ
jgi:hypothetical protein